MANNKAGIQFWAYALLILITISCNKKTSTSTNPTSNPCDSIVCQNGGTCLNGLCQCPAGYSGVHCEIFTPSHITYHNNGLTPISVRLNGDTLIIPIGGNVTFDGPPNGTANGSAYAAITSSLGNKVGSYFFMPISDTFNNQTRNIDVDKSIYLLQVVNNTGYVITDIESIINNGASSNDQTFHIDNGIPSDGQTYQVGYFSSCAPGYSYVIKLLHNDPFDLHYWTYNNIQSSLPCTNNQSYTVHAP